jgi:hypothetical protein
MPVAKRLSALVESRAKARQGGDDGDFARREPVGLYVQLTSEQRKRVLASDQPVGSGLISLPKARISRAARLRRQEALKRNFPQN